MSNLNIRIKKERQRHGWTQVEFANKLGLTKQTINNWENERRTPDPNTVVAIAELFGVTTDYLLGKEQTPLTQEHLTDTYDHIKKELGEDVSVMFKNINNWDEEKIKKLKTFVELIDEGKI